MKEALELAKEIHPNCSINAKVEQWYYNHSGKTPPLEHQISVQNNTHIHIFHGDNWKDCIVQMKGYKLTDGDKLRIS